MVMVPRCLPCCFAAALLFLFTASSRAADDLPGLAGAKRIVFLGDSITYAGQYVEILDGYLALKYPLAGRTLIDLGLPSETVSGLSEPGHADGKFPRPDLHERLTRVLEKTRPDLVVACYGMNCGIYYPFGEERFAKFREGMERLHRAVEQAGAKIVHVTPPTFDSQPIRERTLPAGLAEYRQPYRGYNEVLDRYSAWLVAQRDRGWVVVDLHGPMNDYLAQRRQNDADFYLAKDGVHMNAEGHWLVARQLLRAWGAPEAEVEQPKSAEEFFQQFPHGEAVWKLAQQRQRVLKDAWLSDVGHLRPGMKTGLPLQEAQAQAQSIGEQIQQELSK